MDIFYKNSDGVVLPLTYGNVRIVSLDGLGISNSVNISESADADGGIFQSVHLLSKNIALNLCITGDYDSGRSLVFSSFKIKTEGELLFGSSVKIACQVEKINAVLSSLDRKIQISLVCPDPYFVSAGTKKIPMQGVTPMWEFPFEIPASGFEFAVQSTDRIAKIINSGEAETGCIFELSARANVKNPRFENMNTHEWIELNFEMMADDIITINTIKGQKSITLKRSGSVSNIINHKVWGSTFLQLSCGLNEIVCDAVSGLNSLSIVCFISEKFGGV